MLFPAHCYSVTKTHKMPKVAGHVSPKGPFGAKEPLIIGLEDKASYASTPACMSSSVTHFIENRNTGASQIAWSVNLSMYFSRQVSRTVARPKQKQRRVSS